jgi:DNA invertase Pin-like site-specific DNA recombinase
VVADHVYIDQEISGTTAERPGYRSLMDAAKVHKFEAILVEAQDRLWRDQGEMHNALKRLRFWGVKVFSVAAGADLTALESFLRDLLR